MLIEAFWQQYLDTLPAGHHHHEATYTAWGFGDSPTMADALGNLVLNGPKRATASALMVYELEEDEVMPTAGDISIILNGNQEPLCIIETTEVRIKPFADVDEQFAYDEGEGDRTLSDWKAGHERFFRRELAQYGLDFSEDMLVVLERFAMIYP